MCNCCSDLISTIIDILIAGTSIVALWLSCKTYKRENENRQQDIKLQKWNALYPHRLNCYSDLCNTLKEVIEYKSKNTLEIQNELSILQKKIEKYDEEIKLLFDEKIQKKLKQIITWLDDCKNVFSGLTDGEKILKKEMLGQHPKEKYLRNIQKDIKELNIPEDMRKIIMKEVSDE